MLNHDGYFETVQLFAKDKKGNIRTWLINAIDYTINFSHGVLNGEMNGNFEEVPYGKAGRTRREQMLLRINRMIQNKIDMGYVYSINEAKENQRTNAQGLPRPMLAHKFNKDKHTIGKFWIAQRKLNGFRCLTYINLSEPDFFEMISYTRKGKNIPGIGHIHASLRMSDWFRRNIGSKIILDGELYSHDATFQQISSWVKKEQTESSNLDYVLYDVYLPNDINCPYGYRYGLIKEFLECPNIKIIENFSICDVTNTNRLYQNFVAEGYEGLILRNLNSNYEDSRRSNNLLKVKSFIGSDKTYEFEEEFLVIKFEMSNKGVPVATCSTKDGLEFKVVVPGNEQEKILHYKNQQNLIGKHLTVQFSEWTQYGKPFQPVAFQFRDIGHE